MSLTSLRSSSCAYNINGIHWIMELPAVTTAIPTPFKLRRHHKSHQIAKMPKQSQNSTILGSIHVSGVGCIQTNLQPFFTLFNILSFLKTLGNEVAHFHLTRLHSTNLRVAIIFQFRFLQIWKQLITRPISKYIYPC